MLVVGWIVSTVLSLLFFAGPVIDILFVDYMFNECDKFLIGQWTHAWSGTGHTIYTLQSGWSARHSSRSNLSGC